MDIQSIASGVDTVGVQPQGKASGASSVAQSSPAEKVSSAQEKNHSKENKPASTQDIQKASLRMQDSLARGNIQFSVDEGTGETVVKVVDAKTKDVLMQMPSKTALAIAESLKEGSNTNLISSNA